MQKDAVACFLAGAGIMYFADPDRGKRRRAGIRDKLVAGWHDVANELDKAERDLGTVLTDWAPPSLHCGSAKTQTKRY